MWKTVSETQIDADSKKDVIRTDVIWIRYFECKHTFYILSRFMRIFSEKREKNNKQTESILQFPQDRHTGAHALRKEKATNQTWFFPARKVFYELFVAAVDHVQCISRKFICKWNPGIFIILLCTKYIHRHTTQRSIGNLRGDIFLVQIFSICNTLVD